MSPSQIVEAITALRIGADALRARYPSTQCYAVIRLKGQLRDAHVRWNWPGIVRVTERHNGRFIVESKPGKPHEINLKATA